MTAPILTIEPLDPQSRHIERAVAILEAGGVIAYPTDSYYGIGCDLFNKDAIERIYQIKQRPRTKPMTFICSDLTEVAKYAVVSNAAYALMKRLTPGAFTFVLEATNLVPKIAVTRQHTVGIRVPDSPVALEIVRSLGRPLVSTSAATAEGDILVDPSDIQELIGHELDLVLDAGYQLDEPSTVIDLTGPDPVILRQGKGDITLVA